MQSDTPNCGSGERSFGDILHELERRIAERAAANPSSEPEAPPEPWVDKPGTLIAAENDVWRWELVESIELRLCGGPAKCEQAWCRRAQRCAAIEKIRPQIEQSRAMLALERAKWHPPAGAPPPRRRRRRSKAGA